MNIYLVLDFMKWFYGVGHHEIVLSWLYWLHHIVFYKLIFELIFQVIFLLNNFEHTCIFQRSCYPRCTCTWITIIHNQSFHPCNRFLWFWNRSENAHVRTSILFVGVPSLADRTGRSARQKYHYSTIRTTTCHSSSQRIYD